MSLAVYSEVCSSGAWVLGFVILLICITQFIDVNDVRAAYLRRSGEKMSSSPASAFGDHLSVVTPKNAAVETFNILVEKEETIHSSNSLLTPGQMANELPIFPPPKVIHVGERMRRRPQQQSEQLDNAESMKLLSIAQYPLVQVDVDMNEDGYDDNDAFSVNAVDFIRSSIIRMGKRLSYRNLNISSNYSVIYVQKLYILLSRSPSSSLPQSMLSQLKDTQRWTSEEDYILTLEEEKSNQARIHEATLKINAASPRGINMAIATVMQILSSKQTINSLPIHVYDYPKHAWRGLLIDVARHFFPVDALKKAIDGMELSKLNVLHLHLTDSQSFPIMLEDTEDLPLSRLARNGSFRGFDGRNRVYSLKDLEELVEYASGRGIEVVPEIDVPAHSSSWGKAFPEVVLTCPLYIEKLKKQRALKNPNDIFREEDIYSLDPSSTLLMRVIGGVIRQLSSVFPSKYFHVGGDEVDLKCWDEVDRLKKYGGPKQMLENFEKDVFQIVRGLGKIPIVWQGVIDTHSLPEETKGFFDGDKSVVQPWKCWSSIALRAAKAALDGDKYYDLAPSTRFNPYLQSTGISINETTSLPMRRVINSSTSSMVRHRRLLRQSEDNTSVTHHYEGGNHSTVTSTDKVGHPIIQSACWYLDFNWDIDRYLKSDTLKATTAMSPSRYPYPPYSPSSSKTVFIHQVNGISSPKFTGHDVSNRIYNGKILGGEASLWTERIDYTNFHCRIWPRAGIIAASLWGINESQPLSAYHDRDLVFFVNDVNRKIHEKYRIYILYSLFKDHLETFLDIDLSSFMVFHAVDEPSIDNLPSKLSSIAMKDLTYRPITVRSTRELMSMLESYFFPDPLSDVYNFNGTSYFNETLKIRLNSQLSCRCNGFSLNVSRPLISEIREVGADDMVYGVQGTEQIVSIVQLNTGNGAQGSSRQKFTEWLRVQSQRGVNIVTLCEANTWESLESKSSVDKNRKVIEQIAEEGGYTYSFVADFSQPFAKNEGNFSGQTINKPHPYNMGIMSSLPFRIVNVRGPPYFERGVIHAYFNDLDLHLFVVHLHAHESRSREEETLMIVSMLSDLIAQGKRVVITGDFNTLNPLDKVKYDKEGLLSFYKRRDNPIFEHLRKKYCTDNSSMSLSVPPSSLSSYMSITNVTTNQDVSRMNLSRGNITDDLDGMSIMKLTERRNAQSQIPLKPRMLKTSLTNSIDNLESLELNYRPLQILLDAGLFDACHSSCKYTRWSESAKCVSERCRATEPTEFDFEWPKLPFGEKRMDVRLDYILVSQAVLDDANVYIRSEVQRNNMTSFLSDHYPVQAVWKWSRRESTKNATLEARRQK